MDISEDSSTCEGSCSLDAAAFFTTSSTPNYHLQSPGKDLSDKESELGASLPDFDNAPLHVTPPMDPEVSSSYSDDTPSTGSLIIRQLQRTEVKGMEGYEELGRLGHGGNGNCFLVRHRPKDVLRVCKVIQSKPENMGMRPLEARILQDILPPHERIVRMHELIVTPHTAELYFDFYAGRDLEQLTSYFFDRDMILTENFIWHCYQQLSEALAFIHTGHDATRQQVGALSSSSRNQKWTPIIHGDIKPLNIFVKLAPGANSFPSLVLGDFGNSRLQPGRALLGTVTWMPPEVPEYSVESDVWGMGAVIHALCHNGMPPTQQMPDYWSPTSTNLELWSLMTSTQEREPLRSEYDPLLNQLLEMNLRRQPADRPKSRVLFDWLSKQVSNLQTGHADWATIASLPRTYFNVPCTGHRAANHQSPKYETQPSFLSSQYDSPPQFDTSMSVEPLLTADELPRELFPPNNPPAALNKPEVDQPRYPGSLPDRSPYWFQDFSGNWYTGTEPIQPEREEETDIQPDDYVNNEPTHNAVSTKTFPKLRKVVRVIGRIVKKTLWWILFLPVRGLI